jgi:hypothetical protein
MRSPWKLGMAILAILILSLPLLTACDDDDETGTITPETSTPIATQTSEPIEDMDITIGVISDMTGPASQAMAVVDAALADLVRYYNEENIIPGVHLQIKTYDGQYNPSRDISGYEWLLNKGADVIFTGLPTVPLTLKSIVDKDETMLFSCTAQQEFVDPPGWVFCVNITNPTSMYTLLDWIANNDSDFPEGRPAKIGAVGMMGPYAMNLQAGIEAYANAHPEQFDYVGGYLVDWTTVTWSPEVDSLKDCDYVLLPSTGFAIPGFIGEYHNAGHTAKFIGTDAHPAYLGLMVDGVGWDAFDGMLFALPNRWWTEDAEVPNLANQLLAEYRSTGEAEQIKWAGISYIGSFGMWYAAINVIAEAIDAVGPENFDSQALYNTATSFSMAFGGCEEWSYTGTKRTSWNYLGVYEASAADKDLVRKHPDWLPVRYSP